jgi:tubulin alpha
MSEITPNPKQREVVTLGIGQCGIQMGQEVWKLYCKEHYIGLNGRADEENTSEDIAFTTFFLENSQGQFVPRNCFFDLEPSVCDQIQNTKMKYLFDPEKTVYAAEDGANVYARGKFIASKYIHPSMFLQLRKSAESCNSMNYIHLMHSTGGGTGTGYANKLCDDILDSLGFRNIMAFTVMPSSHYQTSPVEVTNTLLWMSEGLIEGSVKYNLNFDNQSMYRFVKRKFKPTYWHINQLMSFTISGITARMRFSGDLSFDNTDLETNMIPFPSLNMLIANYSPLNFGKRAQTTAAITNSAFSNKDFF